MIKIAFCDDDLSVLRELGALMDKYRVERNQDIVYASFNSPLELLRLAGVDMEQKKPMEDALQVFSEYLDEMERLA